ncbi:MAG: response regulator [Planctomycetota bacterium]
MAAANQDGGNGEVVRNSLGMGPATYERLLEKLAEDADTGRPSASRQFTRIPLQDPFVRVAVENDSGMKRDMVLACRNLSRGGVGLLHSSFMYPDTTVIVYLTRFDGKPVGNRGRVVRVEHRGGVVHEIGIKFEREINPRDYLSNDITEAIPTLENVSAGSLKGDVVFATDNEQTVASIREALLETSLNFKIVADAASLEEELAGQPGMVLIDLELGDVSGPEFIKQLRVRGVNCPIALLGGANDELARSMIRVCGADALLRCPIVHGELLRTLGEFLLSSWDLDALDKARSRVDRGTLVSLCFELNKLGVVMDQQVRVNDRVALFATCQNIRGLALLVGMHGVAGMAERLGEAAAKTGDEEDLEEMIEQVRLGCAAAGRAAA